MWLAIVAWVVGLYLLIVLTVYVTARVAIPDREFRKVFFRVGAILPFIALVAVVKTAVRRKPSQICYLEDIAQVEDDIEAERVRLFGGVALSPSFSDRWKASCLRSFEKAAFQSVKTACKIGRHEVPRNSEIDQAFGAVAGRV